MAVSNEMAGAEAMRKARKKAGLSQKELAARLGVSYQAVSRWERGKDPIPVKRLSQMSELLGAPLSEISEKGLSPAEERVIVAVAGQAGYERSVELLTGKTYDRDAVSLTVLRARSRWNVETLRLLRSLEESLFAAASKLKAGARYGLEEEVFPVLRKKIVAAEAMAREMQKTANEIGLMRADLWPWEVPVENSGAPIAAESEAALRSGREREAGRSDRKSSGDR